jgi:RimJ/RimL family protein N-acetyltransferase
MANAKFKNETIIKTERLRLRPLAEKDVDFIWNARSHKEIYKWTYVSPSLLMAPGEKLTWMNHKSMAGQWLQKSQADDWVRNSLDTETNYNFVIELISTSPSQTEGDAPTDPVIIGSIGLFGDNELGYLFHPSYWGKGYATEAVTAFVNAVWEALPEVQKVNGQVDSENVGSLAVLRKCGFVEEKKEEYENVTMGRRIIVHCACLRPVQQE